MSDSLALGLRHLVQMAECAEIAYANDDIPTAQAALLEVRADLRTILELLFLEANPSVGSRSPGER